MCENCCLTCGRACQNYKPVNWFTVFNRKAKEYSALINQDVYVSAPYFESITLAKEIWRTRHPDKYKHYTRITEAIKTEEDAGELYEIFRAVFDNAIKLVKGE